NTAPRGSRAPGRRSEEVSAWSFSSVGRVSLVPGPGSLPLCCVGPWAERTVPAQRPGWPGLRLTEARPTPRWESTLLQPCKSCAARRTEDRHLDGWAWVAAPRPGAALGRTPKLRLCTGERVRAFAVRSG